MKKEEFKKLAEEVEAVLKTQHYYPELFGDVLKCYERLYTAWAEEKDKEVMYFNSVEYATKALEALKLKMYAFRGFEDRNIKNSVPERLKEFWELAAEARVSNLEAVVSLVGGIVALGGYGDKFEDVLRRLYFNNL